MVLGKLPVPGRPTNLDYNLWQGPIALAVVAGGGCLDIFSLVYFFSLLSPSLLHVYFRSLDEGYRRHTKFADCWRPKTYFQVKNIILQRAGGSSFFLSETV